MYNSDKFFEQFVDAGQRKKARAGDDRAAAFCCPGPAAARGPFRRMKRPPAAVRGPFGAKIWGKDEKEGFVCETNCC